jgi:hypothetical protein
MAKKQLEDNLTPEQKEQVEQAVKTPQTSPTNWNRHQRRHMMRQQGILKYLSKLPYLGEVRSKIRLQNLEQGRKIHQQNVDANDARNAARLEQILEGYTNQDGVKVPGLKDNWKEQGYNNKEIDMLEEAWSLSVIKDKETYQADKKKRRALQKEAKASRDARQK